MNSIIPSNNSVLQHTLAKLTEQDLAALDWRVILRSRHPQECDSAFLRGRTAFQTRKVGSLPKQSRRSAI